MESLCVFYTGKYHLSMILLEYLKRKNINNWSIEGDLENKIDREFNLLKKQYFSHYKNIEIKNINKEELKIQSNKIYILEGNKEKIEKESNKIKKIAEKNKYKNIEIIKCYEFDKYSDCMIETMANNDKILNTLGKSN